MATTKDSNKLTIYKGKLEEYAFIPLDVSEVTSYDFTNSIICNDGSTYIKNITADSSLYNFIKDKLMDASAPAIRYKEGEPLNSTISITNGTYNINGYLSNNMLTHKIKLYYIENFKYTLDASQYTVSDDENTNVVNRGATYMFTIIPKLTKDVSVLEASQMPVEPGGGSGGGSGSGGGDTSTGETEDPNKKYNIVFSVDGNQTLSLTRLGATNNYKLGGTLVIKYEQSDKSIKNDTGTISTITNNNSNYAFLIYLGNAQQICLIQRIDGYNTASNLWEGKININLDEKNLSYTLRPGTTISCELHMKISKDVPIFSKHGSRLNSYVAQNSQGMDNLGLYKFTINNNIFVPKIGTAKAYFLQSLIGQYGSWNQTVMNVMKVNNQFGSKTSGIFIIVSDGKYLNYANISSKITSNIPTYAVGDFKVATTDHNSIFTSPLNNNNNNTTVALDGPPIFLYDESNKQTKIDKINGYETDNNIFDESYFKHKSGTKFPVPASTERKKNIINLNNYKYLMYKQSSSKLNHYCGIQLTNADLSAYEGKTFNVVYEVWTYNKTNSDFQPSINTPIKNKDGEYILTAVSPSQNLNQKIDRIDWETGGGGGTTIKPVNITYTATVTQYKLYSFKLSKTDSTTGVYEYTFTD